MKMHRLKRVAAAALAAGLVAGPIFADRARAEDKAPIMIGALFPMSGIGQLYGATFKIAAELAIADVNAAGGVNGSPLRLQVVDDQLNAQQSVLLYREAVGKNVVAVMGPVSGTSWQNVAPLANSMELLALNIGGVKPGVSLKPWALRTGPADDTTIPEGVAEFVRAFPDAKRIVIAGDAREASGAAGIEVYRRAAEAKGLKVLDTVEFETTTKDFSPIGIKIRGLDPDAVFISALGPVALGLLKELETQGFTKPKLVSVLAWAGPMINVIGSAGKDVYAVGYGTNEPDSGNAAYNAFVTRFTEASKAVDIIQQPANVSASIITYDTVRMIADRLAAAGIDGATPVVDARRKLKGAFAQMDVFKGLTTYRMRDTGDMYVRAHLLKADGNRWVYALPAHQRNAD